ncbi:hypothetical protein PHYC_02677 [Phycisphaerales bacterium]|nr:hypothetical protein PHYC_02677 [Phycisphaerales bacterium]
MRAERGQLKVAAARGMLAALAVFGALLVSGCATNSQPKSGPASPVVRESMPGVEISWWIVDDAPAEGQPPLGETLAELSKRSVPVSWETLDAWRAGGLRVLAVPMEELDATRAKVHLVGPLQSQWLGEAARWTDVARSTPASGSFTVSLDNGPITLRDGRLGLSLRCWTTPDPAPISADPAKTDRMLAVLTVEIVPRYLPAPPDETALRLPGTDTPTPAPLPFDRLRLGAILRGDEALLIVPESPDTEWASPLPPPEREPVVPHLGPQVPAAPNLGEALLTDLGAVVGRRARVFVVIQPSVPRQFRILANSNEN